MTYDERDKPAVMPILSMLGDSSAVVCDDEGCAMPIAPEATGQESPKPE